VIVQIVDLQVFIVHSQKIIVIPIHATMVAHALMKRIVIIVFAHQVIQELTVKQMLESLA